ncbi:META domain-containing protein [Sphingobacterium sp. lm-10]|uniref:META domain-containing protein n=1 Tax=Sphingobacterium sp. lm-10 TaxID=2944904 RepID=UPI00201FE39C|nr:META domain-containing protein [Sphingobacterium sp. lm-10]MCL7988964.1 META domain-containing protein [Sphingobacterium sp. lm-10]
MKYYFWSVLMLVSVLFAGCGMSKEKGTADTAILEDVTWRLTELDGKAVRAEVNGKVPSLTFNSADRRYSAVTGCNGIGGQYEVKKGNQLTFSMGMSTKMYCENNMEVEDGLGKIFPLVKSYQISENNLILKGEGSGTLAKLELMP